MNDFNVVPISESSIKNYIECFEKNGSPKRIENIQWQFFNNPSGKQFVDIAIDKNTGNTAAIYAIFPVKVKIGTFSFIASQSLDTITDVNFRGKGLFIKLATDVYSKATHDGLKFVYGFPNGSSIYGFQKKLEWQVLDPVPFLFKPLKTGYFFKKVKILKGLPNFRIAIPKRVSRSVKFVEENHFPDVVDQIWESFSAHVEVAIERNKEYLDWRYLKKPAENYKVIHAYTSENEYIGFVVYCIKEKHGGKIAYIMEYLYDPLFATSAPDLLKYACNKILEQNADCILSWCFEHSLNFKDYRASGFYKLPEKFRPIELHFGVRAFDKSLETSLTKRQNWYLSYSDSDTV